MANWINKLLALLAILLLAPIFIIAAIGILMADFGPVLHVSDRSGINNTVFRIYKFRSMKRTKAGGSRITTANDSRIFWWGKVLRTLKIDELPQLFNILQGDMAVIGPRPEDVSIVNESYDEVMMESLLVLPGLASPGSLYNYTHLESLIDADGGEDIYLEKILPLKVRLDVVYARNKSFLYDVRIIFKTIAIIFLRALNYASFKDPIELKEAKSI